LEFFFVQKLSTFVLDSLESSHPISVEVNDPSEINSLFDTISYDKVKKTQKNIFNIILILNKLIKGASIIRMMNAFLTEKTFKKGVSVKD